MTKLTIILASLFILALATVGTATAGDRCGDKKGGEQGGDAAAIAMPAKSLA